MSDRLCPYGPSPTRLPCPWDSPGKNTGVGCHCLLQGIFLTQVCFAGGFFTVWVTWCPYKKGKFGHRYAESEDDVKRQGEDGHLQAQERDLKHSLQKEPTPLAPWFGLLVSRTGKSHKFLLPKPSNLCYFVMAAPGKLLWVYTEGVPKPNTECYLYDVALWGDSYFVFFFIS